jgi:tetratricopeptide (TPR) repeat protein
MNVNVRVEKGWCTVLLLAFALAAPNLSAQPKTPAWERWGITQPTVDPAAEPLFKAALNQFYSDQYDSARQAYAELAQKYPTSAEAHLGLSMANRYLFQRDSAFAEAEKVLALDPEGTGGLCNYADLLQPGRGPYKTGPQGDGMRYAASIAAATKAAKTSHRYATYAHVSLWVDYIWAGRLADARREMKFLGEKGYFPPALLDYARNLLAGLESGAILFTNGDNDTEPLLCLQAAESFRPDVLVVNGTFLSLPRTMAMFRDSLKLPLTLSDADLAGKPAWKQVRDDIIGTALKQNRPVYFATTFAPDAMGDWKDHVVGEGMTLRIVPFKTDSTDFVRTIENVKAWRLANTNQKAVWLANMSPMTRHINELKVNYIKVYLDLANHYQVLGNAAKVEEMCQQAYDLVVPLDNPQWTTAVIANWTSLNPNSPRAKELNDQLARLGKDLKSSIPQPTDSQLALASDSVVFRTPEPAPADFDRWTFFWAHPLVTEGAGIGYVVRSGQGEEYFRWGPRQMSPKDSSRSDFWKGMSDPSKLHGKDIVVKFWTDKGKLEFPAGFTLTFEFYKDGRTVKRIQGVRKE